MGKVGLIVKVLGVPVAGETVLGVPEDGETELIAVVVVEGGLIDVEVGICEIVGNCRELTMTGVTCGAGS